MHNFFRTLAPEQFDPNVTIRADGSYTYSYDGILIFVPALIQASRAGRLDDAHMEAQLKEAALQLRQEGFRSADYLGRGRYAVVLERYRARGEPSYFPSREMKVFGIRPQPNGNVGIGTTTPAYTLDVNGFINTDGTLIVMLDRGVNVLRHNSQSKPSAHGLFSGYEWHIKSPDADPFMIVRPVQ